MAPKKGRLCECGTDITHNPGRHKCYNGPVLLGFVNRFKGNSLEGEEAYVTARVNELLDIGPNCKITFVARCYFDIEAPPPIPDVLPTFAHGTFAQGDEEIPEMSREDVLDLIDDPQTAIVRLFELIRTNKSNHNFVLTPDSKQIVRMSQKREPEVVVNRDIFFVSYVQTVIDKLNHLIDKHSLSAECSRWDRYCDDVHRDEGGVMSALGRAFVFNLSSKKKEPAARFLIKA